MANAFYPKVKAKFRKGEIDLIGDTIIVIGIDAGLYTPSSSHEFVSDIPSGARVDTDVLTGKTVDAATGAFDSDDPTLSNPLAATVSWLALAKSTGNVATSPLIILYDTVTDFPTTDPTIGITVAAGGWFE